MIKQKKVPLRRCIGCREMKPKKELLRIVRSAEGVISVDPTGKKNGRGAYICKDDMACFAKTRKSRGLHREFETEVPEAVYEELQLQLEAYVGK